MKTPLVQPMRRRGVPLGVGQVTGDAPSRLRLFTLDNHDWRYNFVTKTLTQSS